MLGSSWVSCNGMVSQCVYCMVAMVTQGDREGTCFIHCRMYAIIVTIVTDDLICGEVMTGCWLAHHRDIIASTFDWHALTTVCIYMLVQLHHLCIGRPCITE